MIGYILLFISTVLAQYPIVNVDSSSHYGTVGYSSVSYTLKNTLSYQTVEIDFWRTQTFSYNQAPYLSVTLKDPNNFYLTSSVYGQISYYLTQVGNYTLTVELMSTSHYYSSTFVIRACSTYCNSACSYNSISIGGYCNGNGACISGACACDNSTNGVILDSYSCQYDGYNDPLAKLLGLWIALAIIAVLLIFVLPIVICVCCCGACAAAGAAAADRQPIVYHHHPPPTHSMYNTVSVPTPGVTYVQAQPVNPYQPMQNVQVQPYPQTAQPGILYPQTYQKV